jgi:phenylacetate-CoA ligase
VERILAEWPLKIGASHPKALLNYLRLLPPGIPAGLRQAAFRRTLRWAASRSPFYRKRFSQHNIRIERVKRPEELGDFYVSPAEIRESPESLLCDRPDLAVESSGTTGHEVRVFLSQNELDYNARQGVLLSAVYGLCRDDRVISTFDYGFCLDGQIVQKALPYWKGFRMSVGRADPAEIYRRLPTYGFNVVMSGTPWLARFTEVAEAEGGPFPLKLLIGGGGGGITHRTRSRIETFWKAPLVMTYGSAETATVLGFECLRRDGYHLNEFDFFVEILDPDEEGFGEVVVTTARRKVMPLIRYRTRDVARFLPGDCSCGFPFRRLSPLRGRLDEIVASVWGNVHPDFFEKLLGSVAGISDDWQVGLQEKEGKQLFQFRLETENGPSGHKEIREQVFSWIRNNHPLAWQACVQKLADVDFVFHPKGMLRKKRKLLRLVDERRPADFAASL